MNLFASIPRISVGDEEMFVRRKSEKEKQEDAEIIELLKHMHQLD